MRVESSRNSFVCRERKTHPAPGWGWPSPRMSSWPMAERFRFARTLPPAPSSASPCDGHRFNRRRILEESKQLGHLFRNLLGREMRDIDLHMHGGLINRLARGQHLSDFLNP